MFKPQPDQLPQPLPTALHSEHSVRELLWGRKPLGDLKKIYIYTVHSRLYAAYVLRCFLSRTRNKGQLFNKILLSYEWRRRMPERKLDNVSKVCSHIKSGRKFAFFVKAPKSIIALVWNYI